MPIKISDNLSAVDKLQQEGIVTIGQQRAAKQDIRPLRVLILNLMPLKKPTELQLLRLLGNSPLQIEIDFAVSSADRQHIRTILIWTAVILNLPILKTAIMMLLLLPVLL